jgi:hypothetical protein
VAALPNSGVATLAGEAACWLCCESGLIGSKLVKELSEHYERTGLRILELAQTAYFLSVAQNPLEQAGLLTTLLSNCTFDRGTLCPTYRKPFDLFAKGLKLEIGSSAWIRTRNPPVDRRKKKR